MAERTPVVVRPALVVGPALVALGDSVSAGVGDAPADGGWVRHLATLVGARPVNLARSGARARNVLREQLPTALALAPPLVTVMIGGNDVLRGDFDVDEVRESLRATLSALTAAGSRVVLVVPPPVGRDLPAPDLVRRVLTRRTAAVRSAAFGVAATVSRDPAVPVVVIDAADVRAAAGPQVFHIDRIHPSPLGHRELARQVATALAVHGWPTTGVLSPVPASPCLALKMAWLAFRGVPWLVRRSRDLLPELARMVVREELLARGAPGGR